MVVLLGSAQCPRILDYLLEVVPAIFFTGLVFIQINFKDSELHADR